MNYNKLNPALQNLTGEVDFDLAELNKKYNLERDRRLRVDGNSQYVKVTGDFSRYDEDPYAGAEPDREPLSDSVEVVVVGGGFAGVLAAVRLREQGFDTIRIIEKGGDLGGTWYWNRYPGVMCDTESYIYMPLLEELNYIPSAKYAPGDEIRQHVHNVAQHYDLYRDACFQTAVTDLCWNESSLQWRIVTDRGDSISGRFVVLATGLFERPKLPGLPGIGQFTGHTFHTSRWDFGYTGGDIGGDMAELADKSVGIIGTGATAVQCIPHLGASAQQLFVFQRTPAAVDVRDNAPTDPGWSESLEPGWQQQRVQNFEYACAGVPLGADLVDDNFSEIGRLLDRGCHWATETVGRALDQSEAEYVTDVLDAQKMNQIRARVDSVIEDKATAIAMNPWHRRWCKRPLFHDEYLATFNRANVTLVDTAGKGVERFTESGVVVEGIEYPLDCLIFASGFEIGSAFPDRCGFAIRGRGGKLLSDYWSGGVRSFHGVQTDGFPNLFFNNQTQNSTSVNYSYMLQQNADHIAYILGEVRRRNATLVEPTATAVDRYCADAIAEGSLDFSFWASCTPGYHNNEGAPEKPNSYLGNIFSGGALAFYQYIQDWRSADKLEGLEIS